MSLNSMQMKWVMRWCCLQFTAGVAAEYFIFAGAVVGTMCIAAMNAKEQPVFNSIVYPSVNTEKQKMGREIIGNQRNYEGAEAKSNAFCQESQKYVHVFRWRYALFLSGGIEAKKQAIVFNAVWKAGLQKNLPAEAMEQESHRKKYQLWALIGRI